MSDQNNRLEPEDEPEIIDLNEARRNAPEPEGGYSLKGAAKVLECSVQYVRYLIRHDRLKFYRERVHPLSTVFRHVIPFEEIEKYQNSLRTHSRREDKRNKFLFYAGPEEYKEIVELVRERFPEVAETMVPANTVKSMGFQRTIYGGKFINEEPREDK